MRELLPCLLRPPCRVDGDEHWRHPANTKQCSSENHEYHSVTVATVVVTKGHIAVTLDDAQSFRFYVYFAF